jgi:hypothetical protein
LLFFLLSQLTAVVRAIILVLNQEEDGKVTPFASATLSNSAMDLYVKQGSLAIEVSFFLSVIFFFFLIRVCVCARAH